MTLEQIYNTHKKIIVWYQITGKDFKYFFLKL